MKNPTLITRLIRGFSKLFLKKDVTFCVYLYAKTKVLTVRCKRNVLCLCHELILNKVVSCKYVIRTKSRSFGFSLRF